MACANLPIFVGGEGEIRTREGRETLPVFKTGAFNRSATSPLSSTSTTCAWLCLTIIASFGVNVFILFPLCPINLARTSLATCRSRGCIGGGIGCQTTHLGCLIADGLCFGKGVVNERRTNRAEEL